MFRRNPLDTRLLEEAGTGAGEGGGAAFDPAAFRAELETSLAAKIMTEVRKDLAAVNRKMPGEIAKELTKAREAAEAAAVQAAADAAATNGGAHGAGAGEGAIKIDPAANAEMQRLSKELKTLKTQYEEAEKKNTELAAASIEKDRISAIRSAVWDLPLKDESAKQLFFDAHVGKIKRDEDGNLIGENEAGPLPLKDYLKGQAETVHPYLLLPKGGGAGGAGTRVKGGGFDPTRVAADLSNGAMTSSDIRNLTADQQQQVWAEFGRVKT